jgi:hypothetical protein
MRSPAINSVPIRCPRRGGALLAVKGIWCGAYEKMDSTARGVSRSAMPRAARVVQHTWFRARSRLTPRSGCRSAGDSLIAIGMALGPYKGSFRNVIPSEQTSPFRSRISRGRNRFAGSSAPGVTLVPSNRRRSAARRNHARRQLAVLCPRRPGYFAHRCLSWL